MDPVCHFHLRNGAMVYRINWNADTSSKGRHESYGMMMNYIYDLKRIEKNNSEYLIDGQVKQYDHRE